jgi:AGZA family xanthine/uracil permease-like MFS transporter
MIIDAIPADIKYAISAGIGLFIAFIGLQGGKLIQNSDSTWLLSVALTIQLFGSLFSFIHYYLLVIARVPGAIFIGMIISAVFGVVIGQIPMPKSIISSVPSIAPTFGQAIFHIGDINTVQMWVVVFTFLLVTFFDTTGTLIGWFNKLV